MKNKISDVIEKLQEILEQEGDLPVVYFVNDWQIYRPVSDDFTVISAMINDGWLIYDPQKVVLINRD